MADPKCMRKIQGMCRCQDCGLMADNADIDVELDCDEIVFEWSDADDSQICNLPPCYGGHRLQTDMTEKIHAPRFSAGVRGRDA